jgi:hypothetical protein
MEDPIKRIKDNRRTQRLARLQAFRDTHVFPALAKLHVKTANVMSRVQKANEMQRLSLEQAIHNNAQKDDYVQEITRQIRTQSGRFKKHTPAEKRVFYPSSPSQAKKLVTRSPRSIKASTPYTEKYKNALVEEADAKRRFLDGEFKFIAIPRKGRLADNYMMSLPKKTRDLLQQYMAKKGRANLMRFTLRHAQLVRQRAALSSTSKTKSNLKC